MNNTENKTNKNGLAYKCGYLLGTIIVGCVAALAIALTVKVIFLLF